MDRGRVSRPWTELASLWTRGRLFAVVGESGCGKTTLARMLLRLIEPDSGEIQFEGQNLLGLGGKELRRKRRLEACAT